MSVKLLVSVQNDQHTQDQANFFFIFSDVDISFSFPSSSSLSVSARLFFPPVITFRKVADVKQTTQRQLYVFMALLGVSRLRVSADPQEHLRIG